MRFSEKLMQAIRSGSNEQAKQALQVLKDNQEWRAATRNVRKLSK